MGLSQALAALAVACTSLMQSWAFTGLPSTSLLKGEAAVSQFLHRRPLDQPWLSILYCRKPAVHSLVCQPAGAPAFDGDATRESHRGVVQVSMGQATQGPCKRKAGFPTW